MIDTVDYIASINEINEEVYEDYLMHFGVSIDDGAEVGSGRYPKGSGKNPGQFTNGYKDLSDWNADLTRKGYGRGERAVMMGFKNSEELQRHLKAAKEERQQYYFNIAQECKALGLSKAEAARRAGTTDTTMGKYWDMTEVKSVKKTTALMDRLKKEVEEKKFIDLSLGAEHELGVSQTTLQQTAKRLVEREGYQYFKVRQAQLTNWRHQTNILVLCGPDTDPKEAYKDHTLIKPIKSYYQETGDTKFGLRPVQSISSDRIQIRYSGETPLSGDEMDGVIQIRRGVADLGLNGSNYAQVRIAVDGTHYLKGMAIYADDDQFPPGKDIIYNTNKKIGTDKYDVFKPMQMIKDEDGTEHVDWDNPFGASIKPYDKGGQYDYIGEDGKPHLSAINKVNDQGDWMKWRKTISPQALSKQPIETVRRQLQITMDDYQQEFEEIQSIGNVAIRKKLLLSFASSCDSTACHLKAKAFSGQRSHVLIATPSLKDDEIFAPNYDHGEWVACIRYPFATTHECAKVRVNNHNAEAIKTIGLNSTDAIGVNKTIMSQMSGADSDGDTCIVVPLKNTKLYTPGPLEGLANFETKDFQYPDHETRKKIHDVTKTQIMGHATNLLTDMQISGGCTEEELARAVKYSMVCVDAQKHKLNYKLAYKMFGIKELEERYQPKDENGHTGPGTLITRANSKNTQRPEMKKGSVYDEATGRKYYGIDPRTGEEILVPTDRYYTDKKTGKQKLAMEKVERRRLVKDARELYSNPSSPAPVEVLYANYSNFMVNLANKSRQAYLNAGSSKVDPEAKKKYAAEVESIKQKNIDAELNSPRERQALILSGSLYKEAKAKNPDLKDDKKLQKKVQQWCQNSARNLCNARKPYVKLTDREWEAINANALTLTEVTKVTKNMRDDELKERALPRSTAIPDSVKKMVLNLGKGSNSRYTNEEIAERFGISVASVINILGGE